LKTAVRLEIQRRNRLVGSDVADLCASFQAAIVDVIADRTRGALRLFRQNHGSPSCLVVAGGVAANSAIRASLHSFSTETGLKLVLPPPGLCTDNGAMIAWAGLERLQLGLADGLDFAPRPRWPLDLSAERVHNGKA
jgi:N6-L-threonylcarbamoyladenine synthase